MKKLLLTLATFCAGFIALSFQDQAKPETRAERDARYAQIRAAQLPSYPLDTCPISGDKLGAMGDVVEHFVDSRLVRLCCDGCVKMVDKNTADVLKKIDQAVVLAQRPIYPLDTCVVSGEKLGGMGDVIDHVDGTRLVRFCCGSCVDAYEKDPASYMAKVDAALIEKLKPSYALTTCPVSGEELGSMGEPVDVLYGVQLVRLCCKGCVKAFHKDPNASLAKIAAAKKNKG